MKVFAVICVALLAVSEANAGIIHGLEHEHSHFEPVHVEHSPIEHHAYQYEAPALPGLHIKHIEVPFPVDKHIKIDRPVAVPVDRIVKVDRPFEVIKYIPQPYIVKHQIPVHVPVVKHIPVPQPIVQVQPVFEDAIEYEPQHQSHGWQPQAHAQGWETQASW